MLFLVMKLPQKDCLSIVYDVEESSFCLCNNNIETLWDK